MSATLHARPARVLKRALLVLCCVAVAAALLVVAYQMAADPGSDRRGSMPANDPATIERGALLARAGNCMGCHTERGGQPYAGGRAIATPFGDIHASNITPDDATGIGQWSADDFWRALHNGKSKDGHFLYPAFPYTSYTKVTREDADALYAYLRTLAPVRQPNREHRLAFPYNQRIVLAFWRALYFRPGEYQPETRRDATWNRGAYLVQGLGHCAACHTPRDALGGSIARRDLAGGVIPALNWHAPALNGGPGSLADWSIDEIAGLLGAGVSARGAAFGPMAEVVGSSLQQLPAEDLRAMAVYLKSLPATEPERRRGATQPDAEQQARLALGAKLYEQHCIDCHGADGRGKPPAYPALAGRASITAGGGLNAIRMVLNGGFPPGTRGNPRPYGMPPFGTALEDEDVAAVVSYVQHRWGAGDSMVSAHDVRRARGVAGE